MTDSSSDDEPPCISFTKMHGCGNDFIVVNELSSPLPIDFKSSLSSLCDRHFSVGADQVLLLERSDVADVRMRVIERDGSESDMCGNGIRCAGRFVLDKLGFQSPVMVETRAGIKIVDVFNGLFRVDMGVPSSPVVRNFVVDGVNYTCFLVNTGEPHIVVFCDDVDSFDLINFARFVRNSSEFVVDGVNVNAVQLLGDNNIKIRTYERGVEGETLSCGTGSTACGVVSILIKGLSAPVNVNTKGGVLVIDLKDSAFLFGPAEFVFDGVLSVKEKVGIPAID